MACPTCGGTAYVLVSPGVAMCTGIVIRQTGLHPSGAFGPTTAPIACETRYQVPNASAPLCECSMQSVGQCADCGTPICLDHLYRFGGKVLCRSDYEQRRQAAAQAKEQAVQDALERLRNLASKVDPQLIMSAPDVTLEHRVSGGSFDSRVGEFPGLSKSQLEALEVGKTCPDHGAGCVQTEVHYSGKWFKKKRGATCHMPIWRVTGKHGLNSAGQLVLIWSIEGQTGKNIFMLPSVRDINEDAFATLGVLPNQTTADLINDTSQALEARHIRR